METTRTNFFDKYKLKNANIKSKLLTRSLLWMSLGLIAILLVAFLASSIDSFFTFVLRISLGTSWIWSWLFNIAIILALFFTIQNRNINIIIPAFIYCIFAVYEGIFLTSIVAFAGGNKDIFSNMVLYMIAPAGIFLVMGFLGYFNLINFTKLIPFASFGFLSLLIMSIILIIINNWVVETIYLYLACLVFIVWVGIDLQMLFRAENIVDGIDKKDANRLAFVFGIHLFIDFINLLRIFIRLFSNFN